MPYKSRKHKTRNQRQHRRAGHVRRVEVTLSADSARDHDISDFLDSLPLGSAAEFIRQAIIEKIDRETAPPQPEAQPAASDQIDQLFAELDHQRREASAQMEAMIAELVELRQAMRQPAPVAAAPPPPPTLPEAGGGIVQSSGIDMSRSRPRPKARKAPAPPPPPDDQPLSEQDAIRLAKIMANSIKRANPGKSGPR